MGSMIQSMLKIIAMVIDKIFFKQMMHSSYAWVDKMNYLLNIDEMRFIFDLFGADQRNDILNKYEQILQDLMVNHWNQSTRETAEFVSKSLREYRHKTNHL